MPTMWELLCNVVTVLGGTNVTGLAIARDTLRMSIEVIESN